MSSDDEHLVREQLPAESLIPGLEETLKLTGEQSNFLRCAIHGMPADVIDLDTEIAKRVRGVQRRAYETYPYSCIRRFHYVSLRMSEHHAFPYVLKTGGNAVPPVLLDIGCCMGTDLRYLVRSGYNPSSVIGCDLRQEFIDLGHELYGDRESCPIPFFVGDVFDIVQGPFPAEADKEAPSLRDIKSLNELRGRVKYIYAGSLFHLYDEGTQKTIARRLATLLDVSPGSSPAIVFGRHAGKVAEGVIDDHMGRSKYAHSPESWGEMWRRIVGDTKSVHVEAILRPGGTSDKNETSMMLWSVQIGG